VSERNLRSEAICRNLEFLSAPMASAAQVTGNEKYAKLLDTACTLFARKD
jgi:hypothetical protein